MSMVEFLAVCGAIAWLNLARRVWRELRDGKERLAWALWGWRQQRRGARR